MAAIGTQFHPYYTGRDQMNQSTNTNSSFLDPITTGISNGYEATKNMFSSPSYLDKLAKSSGLSLDELGKIKGTPKYTEFQTQLQNEGDLANGTPGLMDNIGTGLSAFNTGYGLYDNIFGQAHDYRDAQIGALKDKRAAFNQEVQAKADFRANTASAFA